MSPAAGSRAFAALVAVVVSWAGFARREAGPVDSSHLVEIRHLKFEPAELAASPGDTIVWVNRDAVPHTVAAADSSWSSGYLGPGDSWRIVVGSGDEVDVRVGYLCEYHPTMRGSFGES